MDLNPVQRAFVNETVRPMIETIIKFRARLDHFVAEADNQQDPIANVAEDLNDDATGTAPRTDAPTLQGTHVTQLRTFAANMRDQISGTALNVLIELAVRDVETIVSGS